MPFEDMLLYLDSYPLPTPTGAIDQAIAFAAGVGGKLSALTLRADLPLKGNRFLDRVMDLDRVIAEEEANSRKACEEATAYFRTAALAAGVFGAALTDTADLFGFPAHIARRARTRDLCILPLASRNEDERAVAREVIFSSGRPALIFPDSRTVPLRADLIVVAWDGAACAARALAESLPLLARAREVRLLTVLNDKAGLTSGVAADAARHLAAHGVSATVDEIERGSHTIGQAFDGYLARHDADLLVMGAYGHTRVQEFILGSATEHVLRRPATPVFLSH
jgi:nucleotide-binding universal stress UspA family protein